MASKPSYHRIMYANEGSTNYIYPWDLPYYKVNGQYVYASLHDLPGRQWMRSKRTAERSLAWFRQEYPQFPAKIESYTAEEFADREWQKREEARFSNDHYAPVPWAEQAWVRPELHHYPHLSIKQPGKIAFTEDRKKGAADRQTPIRPGAYLTKFYADVLTPKEIEQWSAKVSVAAGAFKLHFTQDPDEIEQIYLNGPSSCMAGRRGWEISPVRAYAGPDLALAYLGTVAKPTARCVVWPEKKRRCTIYGDIEKMSLLLQEEGYTEGTFDGARMRKIPLRGKGRIAFPYMDCASASSTDEGEFIRVGGGGGIGAGEGGVAVIQAMEQCPNCGEPAPADGFVHVHNEEANWCETCAEDDTFTDYFTEERYSGEPVTVWSSDWRGRRIPNYAAEDSLEDNALFVEGRGEWWENESAFHCASCDQNFVSGEDEGDHGHCEDCTDALIAVGEIAMAIKEIEEQPRLPLHAEAA